MKTGIEFARAAAVAPCLLAFALVVLSLTASQASGALTVEHVPPAGIDTGEVIHIEVLVTADAPVQRVEVLPLTLFAFTNFSLELIHGTETYGVWGGDIPAQTEAGVIEYRIEVTRADTWTVDYDYNLTVSGGVDSDGGFDLPENGWVLFVAGIVILAIFFILEIPLKRRLMDRLERRNRKLDDEAGKRRARRVKKE